MGRSIYTTEHQLLATLLRDVRVGAQLRQVDVAEAMSRSQSFVSDYEAGQRRLDLVELRQLCRVLGTTLPRLVQRYERLLGEHGLQGAASPSASSTGPRRAGGTGRSSSGGRSGTGRRTADGRKSATNARSASRRSGRRSSGGA